MGISERAELDNPRLRILKFWSGGLADRLFEAIGKLVDKKNYDAVKREIQHYLQSASEKISITDEQMPWTDAVQAKIIFMLSAEDNERHLKIMDDLLKLASSVENLSRLCSSNTADKILSALKKFLSELYGYFAD